MNNRMHAISPVDQRIVETAARECRPGCGACCIAPSISSAIPGMPMGKPASVRCIQLDDENRCQIFESAERPAVCSSLKASAEMCGETRTHALFYLTRLDELTSA
jgi:Fe-S-cluster containining protein